MGWRQCLLPTTDHKYYDDGDKNDEEDSCTYDDDGSNTEHLSYHLCYRRRSYAVSETWEEMSNLNDPSERTIHVRVPSRNNER